MHKRVPKKMVMVVGVNKVGANKVEVNKVEVMMMMTKNCLESCSLQSSINQTFLSMESINSPNKR